MSEIRTIFTDRAPAAIGPYSQGKAAGGFLYFSGQIPIVPETGALEQGGVTRQTERVIANIKALLEASNSDLDHVVKTLCFLTDMSDFQDFNEVYGRNFKSAPARSCVAVSGLPKGALVEIEVIAVERG
ncbi:MAG: RidA family protein [Clostridiales bacterium]|jgi:2-iminobutanoate/2-iminopropanoate deaminase|nr:RidA family protein [Clostridiales bacterium]